MEERKYAHVKMLLERLRRILCRRNRDHNKSLGENLKLLKTREPSLSQTIGKVEEIKRKICHEVKMEDKDFQQFHKAIEDIAKAVQWEKVDDVGLMRMTELERHVVVTFVCLRRATELMRDFVRRGVSDMNQSIVTRVAGVAARERICVQEVFGIGQSSLPFPPVGVLKKYERIDIINKKETKRLREVIPRLQKCGRNTKALVVAQERLRQLTSGCVLTGEWDTMRLMVADKAFKYFRSDMQEQDSANILCAVGCILNFRVSSSRGDLALLRLCQDAALVLNKVRQVRLELSHEPVPLSSRHSRMVSCIERLNDMKDLVKALDPRPTYPNLDELIDVVLGR